MIHDKDHKQLDMFHPFEHLGVASHISLHAIF